MISAKEARELSEKGREKAIIKQREKIEELIKEQADRGLFSIFILWLLYKENHKYLIELGYKTDESSTYSWEY